ncbi:hepatocyte growth factor-regulated tyrosine kinase substrate-like [Watersipora subatra]|uniref:hepatocyte growth factor-regulated tyrosine kinase substrate-like n=1 Tax=Watersipora subatra TaxID=2589382 RepID=UPI00355C6633
MSAYGTGKSGFKQALEKGTSAQSADTDWDAIVAICDFVRSGEVKPQYAIENISKKISQDNQTTSLHALQILESVVKNCGPKVHSEVATPYFMEFMRKQSKLKVDSVKAKILELIQCWEYAFRDNSEYSAVSETFNEMKNSGVTFPVLREADAMFTSEVPPEWKEETHCYNCRTEFGLITRRHHCRACGQSFCAKCSSKSSMISKFGIEKEVRVCDSCYGKLNSSSGNSASAGSKGDDSELPAEYLNSPLYKQSLKETKSPASGGKTKEEVEEEEQLQLALAISQSEAEAKEQEKKKRQTFMSLDARPPGFGAEQPVSQPAGPKIELDKDSVAPELQRYFDRGYWEQKEAKNTAPAALPSQQPKATEPSKIVTIATTPSAPPPSQSEPSYTMNSQTESEVYQSGAEEVEPEEDEMVREQFMKDMSSSIDVFVNRMNSNSARGRSIINDSSVQTLFAALQSMHPKLLGYIQVQEDKRSQYEGLQDKLAQLRDARDALNSLRQEHEEKRRIEAQERAKRKQIQMMQKLDVLRKQKQQVLDRQRLEALQKLHQQEAEMKARMQMQKQQTQMRQAQLHGFPQELQTGYGTYNSMMMPGTDYQLGQYGPQQGMGMQPPQMQAPYSQAMEGQQPMPAQMLVYGYDGQMHSSGYQGGHGGYMPPTSQNSFNSSPQPPVPGPPQHLAQMPPQQINHQPAGDQQMGNQQRLLNHQLQQLPNQQQQLPNQQQQLPNQQQQLPNQQQQLPNQQPQLPNQQQQLPNQQPQLPNQQPQLPNQIQQTPMAHPGQAFNPYNMQGMSENLPSSGPPTYQSIMQQPNQHMSGQYPPQHVTPQSGYSNPGQYQQYPPDQQFQQAPPAVDDSQLISFD